VTLLREDMQSVAGYRLNSALALDFALDKHVIRDWSEIPADDFNILRLLQAEQNKYQQEQTDKANQYAANGNHHQRKQPAG